jgi:sec-independent protein translocase protein TatC
MSFLGHLEELRRRLIFALAGMGVAFVACLSFSERLWLVVKEPATAALTSLGYKDTQLVQTTPMEVFSIVWVKLPMLCSVFMASPWLLYQVWAFVAPGLYKRERRLAAPFILSAAGLFIMGGLFAYYVAFRFALTFLLGIGQNIDVKPMITITEYFDIFVNVILGTAVVFELPILIFFLTLLRIASPRFLFANSRYAVLAIVVLAAVITPTADIVNLMLFSVPMVILYFVGVFASYLLVLSRENKRFPWRTFLIAVLIPVVLFAAGVYVAITMYGYKLVLYWPFLTR